MQVSGFDGSVDPNLAPSDSTSNVGSTRFIELVNAKIAIYNKTSTVPLSTGTLNDLAGASGNAFDPQIMWDAQTNRFYYAMDVSVSATTNLVALGFSKTASPNNATTAFCHYNVNFGADLPDYPKLGDSQFFWIVGSNVFNSAEAFLGSDLFALSKPGSAAITTCPAVSSFKFGEGFNLQDPNGQQAFTPVPANEIDNNAVGYVTARTGSLPSTRLSIHRVTRNATTGNPVFQMNGTAVVVPSYAVPPSAPQRSGFANSAKTIDTMDARPTQSVAAIDPAHNNAFGLWVQHTTATSPAGRSEVRWYEINAQPTTNALVQRGKATNAAYFAFNGAISPDRARNGSTLSFGGNMVLGFDTSATTSFPAVRMLSKLGTRHPVWARAGAQLRRQLRRLRLRRCRQQLPLGRLRRRQPRPDRGHRCDQRQGLVDQPVRIRCKQLGAGELEDLELDRNTVATLTPMRGLAVRLSPALVPDGATRGAHEPHNRDRLYRGWPSVCDRHQPDDYRVVAQKYPLVPGTRGRSDG